MILNDMLRDLRERGMENVFQRFYSLYQAKAKDCEDPQQMGRARVHAESLGYPAPFDAFADTFSPFASDDAGFFFPPYQEDDVYVSFDHGDVSSPMVMGSFWKTRGQKRPADSGVPAEFVNADGSAPTKRGIKVKVGSGLLFDETENNVKVEVWTGTSGGVGNAATRNHQFVLDDTQDNENVLVRTKGGHQTTWRDKVGEVYVETTTTGGHKFMLDDTGKKILIQSTGMHTFTIDDTASTIEAATASGSKITIDGKVNDITLETLGKHKVFISDSMGEISATTPLQRKLTISDTQQTIQAFSPTPPQTITVSPTTGTQITDTSPGGATILAAAGPLLGTGQGTSMTSAGGAPALIGNTGTSTSDFQGLMTENLLGAQVKTVTGSWNVLGGFLGSLNALALFLGTGLQLRLVNEDFFTTAYGVHFHIATLLGAPTSAPVFGIAVPGTHTTTQTLAS